MSSPETVKLLGRSSSDGSQKTSPFQGLCQTLGSNLPNLAMTQLWVQSIKTSTQHGSVEQQYWCRLRHDCFSTSRTTASLLERSISVGEAVYPDKFKAFLEYNLLIIRKHCFLWSKPPQTSHETVGLLHAFFFILHHLCIPLNHLSAARMSRSFHVNVVFSFSNSWLNRPCSNCCLLGVSHLQRLLGDAPVLVHLLQRCAVHTQVAVGQQASTTNVEDPLEIRLFSGLWLAVFWRWWGVQIFWDQSYNHHHFSWP